MGSGTRFPRWARPGQVASTCSVLDTEAQTLLPGPRLLPLGPQSSLFHPGHPALPQGLDVPLCRKHPATPGEALLTPRTPPSLVQGRAHLTSLDLPLVASLTPSPRAELSSLIGARTRQRLESPPPSRPASPCPARPPPLPFQAPGSQSLLAACPRAALWQQLLGSGWWPELCLRPFLGPESVKSPPTLTRGSCLPASTPPRASRPPPPRASRRALRLLLARLSFPLSRSPSLLRWQELGRRDGGEALTSGHPKLRAGVTSAGICEDPACLPHGL